MLLMVNWFVSVKEERLQFGSYVTNFEIFEPLLIRKQVHMWDTHRRNDDENF